MSQFRDAVDGQDPVGNVGAETLALLLALNSAGKWDRLRAAADNGDAVAALALGVLRVASSNLVWNGASWDRMRGAVALDAGLAAGLQASHGSLVDSLNGVFSSVNALSQFRSRTVSAVNAANAVTIDLRNLRDTLAIHSAASAGTANLTVEVSSDNVNWLTIDTIAAAATVVKQYTATTVGAGVALSPLSFRYVRITAGAAGAGNTTTLTIGAK